VDAMQLLRIWVFKEKYIVKFNIIFDVKS
jgi:hypothetical protein